MLAAGDDGQPIGSALLKLCIVDRVEDMTCDCKPVNGDAMLPDVRLVAADSDQHYVLIPEAGSAVIVCWQDAGMSYVAMVSSVKEVRYRIGTTYHSMTENGHLIQKGNDTLKDILSLIVEAVNKIVVVQGNNPDYTKLAKASIKINNLLRDAE